MTTKTSPKKQTKTHSRKQGAPATTANDRSASHTIEGIDPIKFCQHLTQWNPGRIDGFTAGEAPVTFRFLTDNNDYVMLLASEDNECTTVTPISDVNTTAGKWSDIVSQIGDVYTQACTNQTNKENIMAERARKHKEAQDIERKKFLKRRDENAGVNQ